MKWEGAKLTGSDNFAERKQYVEAISVSMEIYYLVEQEEVPHTTAVSRRRRYRYSSGSTCTCCSDQHNHHPWYRQANQRQHSKRCGRDGTTASS